VSKHKFGDSVLAKFYRYQPMGLCNITRGARLTVLPHYGIGHAPRATRRLHCCVVMPYSHCSVFLITRMDRPCGMLKNVLRINRTNVIRTIELILYSFLRRSSNLFIVVRSLTFIVLFISLYIIHLSRPDVLQTKQKRI